MADMIIAEQRYFQDGKIKRFSPMSNFVDVTELFRDKVDVNEFDWETAHREQVLHQED